ncbi:regulator of polyketide synthase expression [Bifidobacterium saguini DSM 23967]|uniref:Helix-turn-helix domain-containing protein n=3 Tax=Bifidobacterium TaxID=1678 RepID=A0A2N5ITH1_9BIFI|nr:MULTISPECIES: helix-turn-helix domain-containing protein [Bifidobacterium]KFI91859.1 regulator of polyketide synthase expression [Bifidobacterium saguini DSM 23967]PLS25237.1 polyketide synthase regulator [Bifidobacterium imperatoris]QSY58184.1 helix-turn-helix domain-containing protein [Bifidobacterium imperatoris]QTB90131.1 helix-turn-helix domain-containing protein [Bifidobacterium saguini]
MVMPSDFLDLLAADAADANDVSAADRIRKVLFECLFHQLSDQRVTSLFTLLGFTGEFDCYAIAGYPARSSVRTRKTIEKIVSDFGGVCITAEHTLHSPLAAEQGGSSFDSTVDKSVDKSAKQSGNTVVVALIRPVGAATPEVICNTIASEFDDARALTLGPQLHGANGAMRSIRTALYCLQAAPALAAAVPQLPRPLRNDDALPERAMIGDPDARKELVDVVYGSLAAAGPDDPTLVTVSTFLKYGGSLETAAKELNVHPNTIRYRLKRAAESTGWDASDPREAFVLSCAIALGHMAA